MEIGLDVEVVAELSVPVVEHRPEKRGGNGSRDRVRDACPAWADLGKRMNVVPRKGKRDEVVDEAVRRVEVAVLRDPAEPAGEPDHRSTVRE